MNKTYIAIITLLLILVLVIGGYAFYKANKQQDAYNKSSEMVITTPTPVGGSNADTKSSASQSAKPASQIPLIISTIKDGDKVSSAKLSVTGTTSPGAQVNINGTDYLANSQGKFTSTITLDEGENPIYITATDDDGNIAEWTATVSYELP